MKERIENVMVRVQASEASQTWENGLGGLQHDRYCFRGLKMVWEFRKQKWSRPEMV